jgi:hypothetical protein
MALEVTGLVAVATFRGQKCWTNNLAVRTRFIFQEVAGVDLFTFTSVETDFAESFLGGSLATSLLTR